MDRNGMCGLCLGESYLLSSNQKEPSFGVPENKITLQFVVPNKQTEEHFGNLDNQISPHFGVPDSKISLNLVVPQEKLQIAVDF